MPGGLLIPTFLDLADFGKISLPKLHLEAFLGQHELLSVRNERRRGTPTRGTSEPSPSSSFSSRLPSRWARRQESEGLALNESKTVI